MTFDPRFWQPYFKKVFARKVELLLTATRDRILPAFDGIDTEANEVASAFYSEMGRAPADDSWDMGDAAEAAFERGLAHFEELDGVRQGILNLMAVSLYHLFEQQLVSFHRRQVLHPGAEREREKFSCEAACRDLQRRGADLTTLPSWPVIEELRLVANAVKHGTGPSATELAEARPDLFTGWAIRGSGLDQLPSWSSPSRWLRDPLAGTGLYVELSDLERYAGALIAFWGEFGDLITGVGPNRS